MTRSASVDGAARADLLNKRLKEVAKRNRLHDFELDADRNISPAEALAHRTSALEDLFATLFRDRSVLVLDDVSGIYTALVHRVGAGSVAASSESESACEEIREVLDFLDVPASVYRARMLAFYDHEPYVDMSFRERFEFLVVLGQLPSLYKASGQSFDAIAEACAFFVTHGAVFDWAEAPSTSPSGYNRDAFIAALRKKFDFVTCYSDGLVVATGKLPQAEGKDAGALREGPTESETHDREEQTEEAYAELVDRVKAAVSGAVPLGATVAVVSRGDHEMTNLDGRRGWHFPQTSSGIYAGHYPHDSASAVAHLEILRAKGATYLVFPATALWWLDHYEEFRRHLDSHYRLVAQDDDVCRIYSLEDERPESSIRAAKRARPARTVYDYVDASRLAEVTTLFDAEHYLTQVRGDAPEPDAALLHYLELGVREGYDPHPLFDTTWYLDQNPEIRVQGTNPLVHFVTDGAARGLDPNPYFDTSYYRLQVDRTREGATNALIHYVTHGASSAGHDPNPLFDNTYYLNAHRGLRDAGSTPLADYLLYGAVKGSFASQVHQSIVRHLRDSSRSLLLRGNWRHAPALFFSRDETASETRCVADLAELLATEYHIESIAVFFGRPELPERVTRSVETLVLEDFATACDILRPSAVRMLVKALSAMKPLFAIADADEVLDALRVNGIPSYFLFGDASVERAPAELDDLFRKSTRVLFSSAGQFHAVAEELGRSPTNVALRRWNAADGDESGGAADAHYARSVFELAERDFGLDTLISQNGASRDEPARGTKIVVPCADWHLSGVHASLEAIAAELVEMGWDIEILFTRDRELVLESAGDEAHLPRIPYRFLERPEPGVEGMWKALMTYLESRAPTILFMGYDFVANGVAPALTENVGVVTWLQGNYGDYYEQAYRLGRYCNAVVCVSEHIKEEVVALNPLFRARTRVIHNTSVWQRDVVQRRRTPRSDTMRIIYTGRLVQYLKRILDIVELATALDRTEVPYTIDLVGTFSSYDGAEAAFRARAERHLADGRIRLLGRLPRERVLEQLTDNDFFVLLSESEGLPLSVVEAMARGCVPVVADIESGIPEIVTSGENGLVIPGRDYDEWAASMVELWRDEARLAQLSRKARSTVLDRFTVERIAGQFDALFTRVTKEIAGVRYTRPPALTWGAMGSRTGDVLPPPFMYEPIGLPGLD